MTNNIQNSNVESDDIDIFLLFKSLWFEKFTIIKFGLIASILVVIYSLSLPNVYKSTALASPSQSEDSSGAYSLGGYSALTSLAGLSFSNGTTPTKEAIAVLNSFKFFEENILPNIFLPDLMAYDSWNMVTNENFYNNNLFDLKSNKWVREVSLPRASKPSAQESYDVFKNNHIRITENDKTGFITIDIEHKSAFIAHKWCELIIERLNETFRENQKKKSLLSIEYLNNQLLSNSYAEVKQGISSLLQNEIEQLALIESDKEYILKVIEPPFIPENKFKPNRAVICLVGALAGIMFGVLIVILKIIRKNHY